MKMRDIITLIEASIVPAPEYYIRFGDIPKGERSAIGASPNIYAHLSRRSNKEKGVSVFSTVKNGRRWSIIDVGNYASLDGLLSQQRPAYLVTGRVVGQGIDGEPVLRDVVIVQELRYSQLFVPGWGKTDGKVETMYRSKRPAEVISEMPYVSAYDQSNRIVRKIYNGDTTGGDRVGTLGPYEIYRNDLGRGSIRWWLHDEEVDQPVILLRTEEIDGEYFVEGVNGRKGTLIKADELYHWIITTYGATLVSDAYQSPGGARIWERLSKRPDIVITVRDDAGSETSLQRNWDDHYHRPTRFVARPATHKVVESVASTSVFDWTPGGGSREVKLAGATLIYGVSADTAEAISLRVSTKAKGTGAARAIMTAFCREADERGITLNLGASPLTKATRLDRLVAFYRSLGFETTGRRINPAGDPAMIRKPVKAS
jgi:GNAT superfamily N-acetyltransferase